MMRTVWRTPVSPADTRPKINDQCLNTLNQCISLALDTIAVFVENFANRGMLLGPIHLDTTLKPSLLYHTDNLFSNVYCFLGDFLVRSKMLSMNGVWQCADCEYLSNKTTNLFDHIEAKHVSVSYTCEFCEMFFKTKATYRFHKRKYHR